MMNKLKELLEERYEFYVRKWNLYLDLLDRTTEGTESYADVCNAYNVYKGKALAVEEVLKLISDIEMEDNADE